MQYDAFISYSHGADERVAVALERGLERLARPWLRRRGLSVFRDAGNLNLSPHLWASLERALDDSRFLLLVASPSSAQSPWVAKELQHWRSHRELTQLILIVSDGSLTWDAERGDFDAAQSTAIPSSLHGTFAGEPFYLDMRWIRPDTDLSLENPRFKEQIVRLAAALKGVAVEDIAGEEFEQHRRMIRIRNAAIAALGGLSLAAVAFGAFAWIQRGAAVSAGERAQQSAEEARLSARIAEQRRGEAQAAREQADASAAIATENESVAKHERQRAEQEAHAARVALAQASTREALRLIGENNPTFALAHLAQALRALPGDVAARSWVSGLAPDARAWMGLPHDAPVSSASFSRDGQRVLTTSSDWIVSVWHATTGRRLATPLAYQRAIRSVVFSPDGGRVVIIGAGRSGTNWDGKVVTMSGEAEAQIWNPITGQAGPVLKHQDEVTSAAFSSDGMLVVTASKNKDVRTWESDTGRPVGSPLIHPGEVRTAVFMPDGRRVVTGSADGTVRVWDPNAGNVLGPFHDGKRLDLLRLSPDGRRLVTVAYGGAQVWDVATGKRIGSEIRHEQEPITTAALSPDGRLLAVGSVWDSTARLWDYSAGKPVGPLLAHNDALRMVEFSPDGKWLLTASNDRTARLWDSATGRQVGRPFQHPDRVNRAAFSPDGRRIVTASDDRTARVWDVASAATTMAPLTVDRVASAAFSPDGRRLITASHDGTARVWECATRLPVAAPFRYAADTASMVVTQDAEYAVTVASDGAVRIWNTRTSKAVSESLPHQGRVSTVAVSSDRRRILTAADNTARIWDAATGRVTATLQGHSAAVTSAAFSPDGRLVVTASDDMTARLWDASTGRALGAVLQHRQKMSVAVFSPDGRRVLTASHDYTARLWDVPTGRPLGESLQHRNFVFSASFSADGRQLLTSSADDTARVWDALTGMPIGEPMRHRMWVYAARFSPDGRRIVTGSMDGTARVWDARTGLPLGPPLPHGDRVIVNRVEFSPDGHRIMTLAGGTLRLWPVLLGTSAEGDVALADLAEALGGYRLTELGAMAPLSESERQIRVRRLVGRDGSGFVTLDQLLQPLMAAPTSRR